MMAKKKGQRLEFSISLVGEDTPEGRNDMVKKLRTHAQAMSILADELEKLGAPPSGGPPARSAREPSSKSP